MRLADALQGLDAMPSSLPTGRAGTAAAAAPCLEATAAVASPFAVAVTAAAAAEAEIAAAIDVDSPAGNNNAVVAGDLPEGEEGRRGVVAPMEDLVLEPPALAAAERAEEAAAAMAAMAAGVVERGAGRRRGTAAEEENEEGKGAPSTAAAAVVAATAAADSARASEAQQHFDHVLEALVRARGIVLPRSRSVWYGLRVVMVLLTPRAT